MDKLIKATGILLLSIATGISWTAAATDCKISAVSSFPAGSDGHTGIAGAFIGTVDNTVIIAGGSDFPSLKPWEGGKKIFYDDIYVLKPDADGQWNCTKSETSLPHALGSGCAVSGDQKTIEEKEYKDCANIKQENNYKMQKRDWYNEVRKQSARCAQR